MTSSTEPPAEKASLLGRLLRFVLMVGLAFGAGIAATVAYDRMVIAPAADIAPSTDAPIAPASLDLPPPEPPPALPIDPLAQAINAIRNDLPELAVLDVSIRRDGGVVFLQGKADSRRTVAHAARAVGRVAGVVAVDVRGVEIVARTHVVEAGENPSRIAWRYYGPAGHHRLIVQANPKLESGYLGVGDELVIPPLDE